ncbi:MAG: hypothetical protein LBH38_00315 [Holosporales bacterium]|jgi:cell division transport system permease protein|nr:hypothetical protein [Holosporales bacterium]
MVHIRKSPSDFPFEKNVSSKVLPWVIGALIYLATVAILGCIGVYRTTETWNTALSEHMTIEIPVIQESKEKTVEHLQAFLPTLQKIPGILKIEIIPENQVQDLIAAWVDDPLLLKTLEMPILVDVLLTPGQPVSSEDIRIETTKVFQEARLHNHAEWYSPVLQCAALFQIFSIALALLTGLIVIGTIIFSTHASLVVHQRIVNILQLIGATDAYIAQQFEKHTLRMALQAVLIAITITSTTLFAFQIFSDIPIIVGGLEWSTIALMPVLMMAIVLCATRLTVIWSLYKKDLSVAL